MARLCDGLHQGCRGVRYFRRAAERPSQIEKRPALRNKQGMWTLFGEHGQVLKRGHELPGVIAPVERRLLKAIDD